MSTIRKHSDRTKAPRRDRTRTPEAKARTLELRAARSTKWLEAREAGRAMGRWS